VIFFFEKIFKKIEKYYFEFKEYLGVVPEYKQYKGSKTKICYKCKKYNKGFCEIYKKEIDPHLIVCEYAKKRGYIKKRRKKYILKKVKKKG
jgi:hypothetical protein